MSINFINYNLPKGIINKVYAPRRRQAFGDRWNEYINLISFCKNRIDFARLAAANTLPAWASSGQGDTPDGNAKVCFYFGFTFI